MTDPAVGRARERGIPVHVVGAGIVKALSDSVTPQGIVAVAASPLRALEDIRLVSGLVLVLVAVSDPGNAGTLVRTAAAAGADGVVLTSGSADVLNPKTVRAAAAALFEVPLVADVAVTDASDRLHALGYQVVGAEAASSTTIYDVDLAGPTAIVVGNEARGLSPEQKASLDLTASIPMPGPVESLNVAMAGSIVVFECLRQRQLSSIDLEEGSV
jgi:TrmH family RNA methyltransferase